MKETSILLLSCVLLLPVMGCAEPAAQAPPAAEPIAEVQPAVQAAPVAAIDPAELLPKGKMPIEGVLTGGQPSGAQLEAMANLGYKTVINMRGPGESGSTDPALVESLGMTYVAIPITGADDVSEENARKLAEAMGAGNEPVIVHCASANRVGALFAMKAYYLDGQTAEEALALAKEVGVTRLEPVVRQRLGLE